MNIQKILELDVQLTWKGLKLIDIGNEDENGNNWLWVEGAPARPGYMRWVFTLPYKLVWERKYDTEANAKQAVQEFITGVINRERTGTDLFAQNRPRPFQTKAATPTVARIL